MAHCATNINYLRSLRFAEGIIVFLVFFLIPLGTFAQPDPSNSDTNISGADSPPSVSLVRTDLPPKIDGLLTDSSWSGAPVISNFTQVRPNEGQVPSEKTEIRILYDSHFIYVGVRAYDSEPDKIIARVMQRDITLRSEDRIRLTFDTFRNSRSGYYFAINPLGARRDGLVDPTASLGGYQADWDGIWYGKSEIDELGWTAEIAIPAKTLNFDPSNHSWGFNVERDIQRKNEKVRWAGPTRNRRVTSMKDAGVLQNLSGLKQGKGIDFIPFANLKFKRDSLANSSGFDLEPGFDLFYKITPAVTAAFTLNTDFAEAEVDNRQINLTRFPLFFEEKRDFFLQDANIFKFADIRRSPLPFFSRRIGLGEDNEPVDIIAGAKVTGRVGRVNFGVLSVRVDEFAGIESKNLSVAKAAINLWDESTVGFIATHGDPETNGDNSLYGFDFNYRNSNFKNTGQILESNFYFMQSDTSGLSGDEYAFGAEFDYPNDKWRVGIEFEQIGENFNPALGFVSETGVRQYLSWLTRTWHPANLDDISVGWFGRLRTRMDGSVVDSEIWLPEIKLETLNQDELFIVPVFYQEQLFEPFEIVDGIFIPPGKYKYNRFRVEAVLSGARKLGAEMEFEFGDFFGGERTEFIASVGWRPNPHFNLNMLYETNDIKLPQGDFTIRVIQVDFNFQFSPNLIWNITNQWDNDSDEFGVNSRIRWIIKPGQDLFIVFNSGVDTSNGRWRPTNTELSTKLAWTFRF